MIANLWAWFAAQVWPNLVASGICTGIVWWRLRARLVAHHLAAEARHLEHMARLDRLHETASGRTTNPTHRKD